MGLLDFLEDISNGIAKKTQQDILELQEAFFSIETDGYYLLQRQLSANNKLDEMNKFQSLEGEPCNESNRQEPITSGFFERISLKTEKAIDQFLQNLQKVEIQDNPEQSISRIDFTHSNVMPQSHAVQNVSQAFANKSIRKAVNLKSLQDTSFVKYQSNMPLPTLSKVSTLGKRQKQTKQAELKQNNKTAKDILAEIEQMHRQKSKKTKKSPQNRSYHQSLNVKDRIIKLNPEATYENKQKKKIQAELKIKNNIQFLQSIRTIHKKEPPISKQFKNQREQVLKANLRIKKVNRNYLLQGHIHSSKELHMNTQLKKQKSIRTLRNVNSSSNQNIFVESSNKKLPPIEKRQIVRPQPFSVYSVYQKSNEYFIHAPVMRK